MYTQFEPKLTGGIVNCFGPEPGAQNRGTSGNSASVFVVLKEIGIVECEIDVAGGIGQIRFGVPEKVIIVLRGSSLQIQK